MKKLFSMLAFTVMMIVSSAVVRAAAYIDIDMLAEFHPAEDAVRLLLTAKNKGDRAADVDGLSIFMINVYDGDGNVIFASKMMQTNDKYFPKFHIEPGETVENIAYTFYNASSAYCGDMLINPQNYTDYWYPVEWKGEVRYY